ncbi:SRPBCC domain-containing protein [Actinosynnema sp. NPDC050801]|uniref:SRPBCC family protein n=1 Tax=unclassified Actinosynnema TaxID=2637065 RepID=UPI0033F57EF0
MSESAVRVRTRVERSVEATWRALVDPLEVTRWFGELERPWQVGRENRVDFGDGDFFTATAVEIVDRRRLDFEWSFLGLGPVARIRWSVTVLPDGTEVEVVDREPDRTPAEVDQMVAGWTDFFERLERYLRTGENTRYGWREDIDGSVDLPRAAFPVLERDELYRWLPVATDGFEPSWFFVVDDQGPRRFRLTEWRAEPDRVNFSVEVPGARRPTSCTVTVEHLANADRLAFSHSGWGATGLPDRRAHELRRRFAATWTAALRKAGDIARNGNG